MSDPNVEEHGDGAEESLDPGDVTDSLFAGSDSEQLREAEERVLRAQAELENFRKRARRELDDERRYAYLPLFGALLPVLDNLERATGAAEEHEGSAGLLEGVQMVADQLRAVLDQYQCQPIKALGEPFDPNLHEAIGQEPNDAFEAGSVSRVTQTGYRLHDRVVRPAQVMISTGPAADGGDTGGPPG